MLREMEHIRNFILYVPLIQRKIKVVHFYLLLSFIDFHEIKINECKNNNSNYFNFVSV